MSELYWLTRLDGINIVLGILLFISIVVAAVFLIGFAISGWKVTADDYTEKDLKTLKMSTLISVLLSVLFVFVPSKEDALLIWGVGGTIDYIKSNKTAKQLPDKCIKALDKWVDECMLDENKNKEK